MIFEEAPHLLNLDLHIIDQLLVGRQLLLNFGRRRNGRSKPRTNDKYDFSYAITPLWQMLQIQVSGV